MRYSSLLVSPADLTTLTVNQFSEITIIETGEKIKTTNPDEVVVTGTLVGGGVFTAHLEGGKRNGSGVQIDITGDEGDLQITNTSAFGGVGDDYIIKGAHGDNIGSVAGARQLQLAAALGAAFRCPRAREPLRRLRPRHLGRNTSRSHIRTRSECTPSSI